YLEGAILADRIAADGPLAIEEIRTIGLELLDALEHAHRLGVVHRDIKPANVFLHAGHALLADFGVAQLLGASSGELTGEGVAVGTMNYMAPEHRGKGISNHCTDLWELGATLFEASTGVRWTSLQEPDDRWRGVSTRLREPLRRALSEQPRDRWQSAGEFRRSLAPSRPPWLVPGIAVATLLAAYLAMTGQWQSRTVLVAPRHDTVDIWELEVARHAGLALEWMPSLRVAGPSDTGAVPRFLVTMHLVLRTSDTSFDLEGRGLDGELVVPRRVARSSSDPRAWGAAIAAAIVGELFPEQAGDLALLAQATENVQAWRAWARGSTAFQAGDWELAEREYTEALRRDPDFVTARWSLLLARMWQRESYAEELPHLLEGRARLPEPVGALIEAQMEPDLSARLARFDSLAATNAGFGPFASCQRTLPSRSADRPSSFGRSACLRRGGGRGAGPGSSDHLGTGALGRDPHG
ncbi:MAG TPA: serine/threonine-protein kinase, partial [Gemmatimonadales bacterium]|nr:serine/threonine-protein kinase [Gemmatimonadales bacterium]